MNWYEKNHPLNRDKMICVVRSNGNVIGKIPMNDENFSKRYSKLISQLGNYEVHYEMN